MTLTKDVLVKIIKEELANLTEEATELNEVSGMDVAQQLLVLAGAVAGTGAGGLVVQLVNDLLKQGKIDAEEAAKAKAALHGDQSSLDEAKKMKAAKGTKKGLGAKPHPSHKMSPLKAKAKK